MMILLSPEVEKAWNDPLCVKASELALKLHGYQFYTNHLARVVKIGLVAIDGQGFSYEEIRDLICAWRLHDAPEDKGLTYFYMRDEFNERIANLTFEVKKDPETGEFPRLKTELGYDVKFADRYANITSAYLRAKHPEKIKEYLSTAEGSFDTKQHRGN